MNIEQMPAEELQSQLATLKTDYATLKQKHLDLDITRGKPGEEQLALSAPLDGILNDNYRDANGTDVRNYGGLDGLPEARTLFADILNVDTENLLVGGNSSLTLMYLVIDFALRFGFSGPESAWQQRPSRRFLCPVPGYDRHFAICEHLNIEMVPVPLLETGPDMDVIEQLVEEDSDIVGMWCVPRFSNPTGCVYDDDTVERIARLGQIAAPGFLVMWDNAYAVHTLYEGAPELAPVYDFCMKYGTENNLVQFGSTSKITFAGAGVAFLASGNENLLALKAHLEFQTIGPDKVNQLRHVRWLQDKKHLTTHMQHHAAIIAPRFEAVLKTLRAGLAGSGMGSWSEPGGGYFISFETRPGLAARVVELAANIGVKLTPAGATFPYGDDPKNSNIRLAPTFPSAKDVQASVDVFVLCVKLASIAQRLEEIESQ